MIWAQVQRKGTFLDFWINVKSTFVHCETTAIAPSDIELRQHLLLRYECGFQPPVTRMPTIAAAQSAIVFAAQRRTLPPQTRDGGELVVPLLLLGQQDLPGLGVEDISGLCPLDL